MRQGKVTCFLLDQLSRPTDAFPEKVNQGVEIGTRGNGEKLIWHNRHGKKKSEMKGKKLLQVVAPNRIKFFQLNLPPFSTS